jgi:hypothetical protein
MSQISRNKLICIKQELTYYIAEQSEA